MKLNCCLGLWWRHPSHHVVSACRLFLFALPGSKPVSVEEKETKQGGAGMVYRADMCRGPQEIKTHRQAGPARRCLGASAFGSRVG
jgi:hypothetical protein